MRSLFDQYETPENRLTHALVCCLSEEPLLLRRFITWATGTRPVARGKLDIIEQQLPGEEREVTEQEAERRGLPDVWIHDGETWALLIENKVSSPVLANQLKRHRATAQRRGFEQISLLVISVDGTKPKGITGCRFLTWPQVYTWFRKEASKSTWAERLVNYMEVAEARMTASGYLKKGTLTVFSGIPFDERNPYNYLEAKRVLGLVMESLRHRKDLREKLGIDPNRPGRPAITGAEGSAVWDFLWLAQAKKETRFEIVPHLTVSIEREQASAMVTLPNGLKPSFRRNLVDLTEGKFLGLVQDVESRLSKDLGKPDAIPWMYVVQRHFSSRSAPSVTDARLNFDLRTARESGGKAERGTVRAQPKWLDAANGLVANKRGNTQVGIGAIFPYRSCKRIGTPGAIDLFAATWIACKPVLDAVFKGA